MTQGRGPAPSSARPVQVLRFKQNPSQVVRFIGELRGALMHWDGDYTSPCLAGECPRNRHEKQEIVFRAYAPAEYWDSDVQAWYQTVLEATPNLEEQLRGMVLRGSMWLIEKKKYKGKSLPMHARFLEDVDESKLRAPFDVCPVLARIYKGELPIFGATNDQIARVMAEPVEGDAPTFLKKNRPEAMKPMSEKETRDARVRMGLDPETGRAMPGARINGKAADYV